MPKVKASGPLVLDRVIVGDCIAAMNALPEGCADMVFADPPYHLQLRRDLQRPEGGMVAGVSEEWDLFDGLESYDAFTRAWLKAARRILKPDGTIWAIGSYHNFFGLALHSRMPASGCSTISFGASAIRCQTSGVRGSPMPMKR